MDVVRIVGWGLALLTGLAPPAWAETVDVRVGAHKGFGRVVLEAPDVRFTTERQGDVVVVHVPMAGRVASAEGTRNVVSVTGGLDEAWLTVVPGARVRVRRLGDRVVVDVMDPARPVARHEPGPRPAPSGTAQAAQGGGTASGPAVASGGAGDTVAATAERPPGGTAATSAAGPGRPNGPNAGQTPERLAPTPAQAEPASPERGPRSAGLQSAEPMTAPAPALPPQPPTLTGLVPAPVPGVVRLSDVPTEVLPGASQTNGPIALTAISAQEGVAVLPFAAGTGAATFRRRNEGWAVFDERRPLDLAGLTGDATLRGARVTLLPDGTLVRVALPPGRQLRLERQQSGWALAVTDAPAGGPVLTPRNDGPGLLVPTSAPGAVVAVADEETGQNLLVGTLRGVAGGSDSGVPVAFRVPAFSLLPSWQGLVVEPLADRTSLRSVKDGFVLEAGVPLSPAPDVGRALESAAVLTRQFDFPDLPASSLMRRLQMQVADEGTAPAQAKLLPREAVAQTMLALGMGPEAESLLGLALADDPRAAGQTNLAALTGVAALLSGRPAEAGALLEPGQDGPDEMMLWRAVRQAMVRPGAAQAAPVFAAEIGLVLAYPAALRTRLLPLAAETMARGGAPAAADALLAKLKDDPSLDYARALRMAAKGDIAGALALYDRLAAGRDQLTSTRATTAAVLLRLQTKAIGPADAAAVLESNFFAWRGDDRERESRLRDAALRADAGQWRLAINGLRDEAALYPDDARLVRDRVAGVLKRMLSDGADSLPALDLVALADENAEALAQADPAFAARLMADKLTALDLPERAEPIIEKMMFAAAAGEDRAMLGRRLAAMRLEEADAAGAGAALEASDAPGLPAPLVEERGLLQARVLTSRHDVAGAAAVLAGIDSAAADDLRATILGAAGEWQEAEAALATLVTRIVPEQGSLDSAQQDALVRLASAQSRAGDEAGLRSLGVKQAGRVVGKRAEVFRLLTAAPVSGVGDLKRAAGEVALAGTLQAGISALGQ